MIELKTDFLTFSKEENHLKFFAKQFMIIKKMNYKLYRVFKKARQ